jgi:hypothetical protein
MEEEYLEQMHCSLETVCHKKSSQDIKKQHQDKQNKLVKVEISKELSNGFFEAK